MNGPPLPSADSAPKLRNTFNPLALGADQAERMAERMAEHILKILDHPTPLSSVVHGPAAPKTGGAVA